MNRPDQPFLSRIYNTEYTIFSYGKARFENGQLQWKKGQIILHFFLHYLVAQVSLKIPFDRAPPHYFWGHFAHRLFTADPDIWTIFYCCCPFWHPTGHFRLRMPVPALLLLIRKVHIPPFPNNGSIVSSRHTVPTKKIPPLTSLGEGPWAKCPELFPPKSPLSNGAWPYDEGQIL